MKQTQGGGSGGRGDDWGGGGEGEGLRRGGELKEPLKQKWERQNS